MENDEKQEQLPVYIHRFPFRFVKPYPYTYRTFTKGRWVGKPLLPTLVKEFKAYPPDYYEHSIQTGRIKVNDKVVAPDYQLKNGDEIVHVSLRVEPPVLDLPIQIIDQTDDFLVVNKPPSIIVHTGGGHHFNTIENLLKYQYKYFNLHILHRLDKCTSGLLIFAKNKAKVGQFHEESGKEVMKKMYYARVAGEFPWQEKQLSAFIECVSHKEGIYRVTKEIDKPQLKAAELPEKEGKTQSKLKAAAQQQGLVNQENFESVKPEVKQTKQNEKKPAQKDWKDSRTIFKRVWYDQETDSSLLQCYPVTGRTHQIRVHLQFLGFPILNDVVYGGRFVGNKVIDLISRKNPAEDEGLEGKPHKKVKLNEQSNAEDWDYETKPWEIMLHSFRYKFSGKQFQTSLPYWFFRESIRFKGLK